MIPDDVVLCTHNSPPQPTSPIESTRSLAVMRENYTLFLVNSGYSVKPLLSRRKEEVASTWFPPSAPRTRGGVRLLFRAIYVTQENERDRAGWCSPRLESCGASTGTILYPQLTQTCELYLFASTFCGRHLALVTTCRFWPLTSVPLRVTCVPFVDKTNAT